MAEELPSMLEPMSFNEYGGTIEEFTTYCLAYWLQQNPDHPDYAKMKGKYEEKTH